MILSKDSIISHDDRTPVAQLSAVQYTQVDDGQVFSQKA